MSRKCVICNKSTITGRNTPRKGLPKKKGGAGQHIVARTARTFKPNLVKVRALIKGRPKSIKICTRCLRTGKILKA